MAKKLIPDFLPKIFVEGYEELEKAAVKMNWPAKPKLIFTSICHFNNEVFNHWCGKLRENGSALFVGEHGGFGTEI